MTDQKEALADDACREAFETWARKELSYLKGPFLRGCNDPDPERAYERLDVEQCWLAFQAAWNTRATPRPVPESCDGERILAWLDDPNRKPANLAFTEGLERQIAYRFENATPRPVSADEALRAMLGNNEPTSIPERSILVILIDAIITLDAKGYKVVEG